MSTEKLPLILVVDDQRTLHMMFRERFDGVARQLHAYTVDEARSLFETHERDIAIVVMDACVPGRIPTTTGLVSEMRRTFRGPIIGCSNEPLYLTVMRDVGCSHTSDKTDVFTIIERILGK